MESFGETIWFLAFLVQYAALVAFSALAVAVLARSLFEFIRDRARKAHIPTPMAIQESVEPSALIKP